MQKCLVRKGLIYGILMILIFLNFMPTISSEGISIEKKFGMLNSEDEKYNDYRDFYDITYNQLYKNLPDLKLHRYIDFQISYNLLNKIKASSSNDCIKFEASLYNGDYTPHGPIRINNDEDFTYENGVTGGSGTENDPFIIEGWEIDTKSFAAIYIEYTTAYFVIRNCLLKSATYGINLETITVGSISDCIILSNTWGIDISRSTNIILRNNTCYDNKYNMEIFGLEISHYYHDIDTSNNVNGKPVYYLVNESNLVIDENYDIGFLGLISCVDILVTDVTISDSYNTVLLVGSSNITISSSNFLHSSYGIHLYKSPNNTIIGCNLFNASIVFWESPNTVMRETSISGDWGFSVGGLSLDDYYQDIDTSNTNNGKPMYYLVEEQDDTFKESSVGFLALVNCNNMIVENVKISNNGYGMVIAGTKAIINNCETSYNEIGLHIFGVCDLEFNNFKTFYNMIGCLPFYSSNIDFFNCDIGGFYGCIQIDYSHDITIDDCVFSDLYDDAVTLINSYNIEISNNEIPIIQGYGIIVEDGSWGNTISHNNIHSGFCGIEIYFSYNNSIYNNDIHDLIKSGIRLFNSVENNIHHNNIYNIVSHERASGVDVYKSEGCKINYNNIYDNNWGLNADRCNVDATYNWWGSKNGPSGIGPGDGDWIEVYEATVSYEPWLESPLFRSKQAINGYSGLFLRFLERFPLLERFLTLLIN